MGPYAHCYVPSKYEKLPSVYRMTLGITLKFKSSQKLMGHPVKLIKVNNYVCMCHTGCIIHMICTMQLYRSKVGTISYIIMRNHVRLKVSPRILYCDTGYGLGGSLGDCRPALPKGQKYQMVKTQTNSHNRRPIV